MRHNLAVSIAAVTILAAGISACGPTTVNTKPSKTSAAKKDAKKATGKHDGKPGAKAGKPEQDAGVGDTITLHGMDDGSQVEVTLVKWLDNAKSADAYMGPEKGKRWVAAQLRLTNTGTAVYSDSPENGAKVADGQGQQFQPTYGEITAGPAMTSGLRLAKGAKGLGWIVFEVPKDSKITTLQMALDSGFADETGQWNLT